MTTLILTLALLGQVRFADMAKTPAPTKADADPDDLHAPDPAATVKPLPTPPAGPPLVVQFHEDAATKGDLSALAERIERAIRPLDVRLVAVEGKVDRAGSDLAALRSRVERVEQAKVTNVSSAVVHANLTVGQATASRPAPPKTQLWQLYDNTGVRCTGRDPDELTERVRQRNAFFANQAAQTQTFVTAPAYTTYSAPMSFGSYGGWEGTPPRVQYNGWGPVGGGFMGGGGCAGGSCR